MVAEDALGSHEARQFDATADASLAVLSSPLARGVRTHDGIQARSQASCQPFDLCLLIQRDELARRRFRVRDAT